MMKMLRMQLGGCLSDSVFFMWKLLTLLGLGMFLTLLIGGKDYGQVREGLMVPPETAPTVTAAAFDPEKLAPLDATVEAEPVALATYVPIAPPAPVVEPAAVAEAPATVAPVTPKIPVFNLANAPATLPVRYVTSASINMREGPSKSYAVIGRLTRNEAVSVVSEAADGWVRVRIEGDGIEGYVAGRLLTDREPGGN